MKYRYTDLYLTVVQLEEVASYIVRLTDGKAQVVDTHIEHSCYLNEAKRFMIIGFVECLKATSYGD